MAIFAAAVAQPALANDDAAWIKKCIGDNADQGQSAQTISVYCACMTEKMDTSETLSVTAWEKSHPQEQAACSSAAGWKG
ncbi:MAG: hypothetical protein KL863_24695 [Rhizobium sp.]|nr:hypothetical protein [Rhizobium sp.]MBX9458977.1 hypothetical protein [Rhizobium sp.]